MRPPTAIAQLLLLLSRPILDREQALVARRLCLKINDWDTFVDIAFNKFSVPWIFDHLSALAPEQIPAQALENMRMATVEISMLAMRVVAEQLRFQKNCLEPLDVKYVFIKGPSLAARYHSNPLARFSRDIDVLVSTEDHEKVVKNAISRGYLVWDDPDEDPKVPSPQALRALLRYEGTVTLVSQSGVTIEVHRDIDKFSGLFQSCELLATTEEIPIANATTRVLPTPKLFCYICYHNSRHIWSKLHWLADLDAMITHPDFDRPAVLSYAESRGLRPTVEACLELHQLTLTPETWDSVPELQHGMQLLNLCLDNLKGDMAFEYSQRAKFGLLAIPFTWMLDKRLYWPVMGRHLVSRIKPNYAQYSRYPLPACIQFLYYFTRPISAIKRRFSGSNSHK